MYRGSAKIRRLPAQGSLAAACELRTYAHGLPRLAQPSAAPSGRRLSDHESGDPTGASVLYGNDLVGVALGEKEGNGCLHTTRIAAPVPHRAPRIPAAAAAPEFRCQRWWSRRSGRSPPSATGRRGSTGAMKTQSTGAHNALQRRESDRWSLAAPYEMLCGSRW
jgi:hypothetical protein